MSFLKKQLDDIKEGKWQVLKIKVFKVIAKINIMIIFPIFIFPVLIIRLIKPIYLLRFGCLESKGIGHFSLPVDIYLSEIDCDIHKKTHPRTIDIWSFDTFICNKVLADKWANFFKIFPWIIVKPLMTINKFFPNYQIYQIPYRYIENKPNLPWQYQDIHDVQSKTNSHISFNSFEKKIIQKSLHKLNVFPHNKIVTFIFRDIAHHGFCSDAHRNSDIELAEPSMEFLAKLNYKVFRIGSNVVKPIKIINKNIIDYPISGIRTELLDLFIISKCEFYVSNGLGLDGVAAMFRRPMLFVNYPHIQFLTINPIDLFIPKHFWSIEEKRMLSFKEIINIGAHTFTDDIHYKRAKIKSVDNTQDEILDAIVEMEKRLNKTWVQEKDEVKLQNKFRLLWEDKQKYKGKIVPKIGYNFIKKNRYYLN
jgi:putative glycosyltransferase (TIGR04372 family)